MVIKINVIKIDIDKNTALANLYQIRSVPTLAVFKKGALIWKQAGLQRKEQLIHIVNQFID